MRNGYKSLNNAQLKELKKLIQSVVDDESGAEHAWMKVDGGYITVEDNTPGAEEERMIDVLFVDTVDYLGYAYGEFIFDFGTIYGASREDDMKYILDNIKQYFDNRSVPHPSFTQFV